MNAQEIKTIEKVLKATTKGLNPKLLQLFKLITDPKTEHDEEAICYRLYKKSQSKAYEMLKHRLYHKILQVLVLISEQDTIDHDHYHAQDLLTHLRSLSIHATLLTKYGLSEEEQDLWRKILESAQYYHLPGIELEAYLKLLPILFGKKERNRKAIKSLLKEITNALKRYESDVLAFRTYYAFYQAFKYRFASPSVSPYLKHLLSQLEKRIRKHPSPRAVLTWNQLLLKYSYLQDHLEEQYKAVVRLQDLIRYYPQILSVNLKEQLYFDIALFYLAIYDLSQTLSYLQKAYELSNPQRVNHYLITLYLGVVRSLLGKHEEGLSDMLKAKAFFDQNPSYEEYRYLIPYYLAFHFFLRENYSNAGKHLYSIEKLDANKPAWSVAIRLLSIMLAFANNDYDYFLNQVESFRKFLSNNEIKEPYPHVLYQSFLVIEKTGFHAINLEEKVFVQLKQMEQSKYRLGYLPFYPYLHSLQNKLPYRESLVDFYAPLRNRIKGEPEETSLKNSATMEEKETS
jgi:tetratricopeptide (TPR) repeat protein